MKFLKGVFSGLGSAGVDVNESGLFQRVSDTGSFMEANRIADGFSKLSQDDFNKMVGRSNEGVTAHCRHVAKRVRGIVSPIDRPRLLREHQWCQRQ